MIYSVDSIENEIARLVPDKENERVLLAYLSVLPKGIVEGSILDGEAGRGFKLCESETDRRRRENYLRLMRLAGENG